MKKNIVFLLGMAIVALFAVSGCGSKSKKIFDENGVRILDVKLDLTEPSIDELFSKCEPVQLDSDPQCLIARIGKTICVNDSIIILDDSKSNVFLFSGDGDFLNQIGSKGKGPEEYYLCYYITMSPDDAAIFLVNPMGELIKYDKTGKFIGKKRLEGKPNYYACEMTEGDKMVIYSAVDIDEAALMVANSSTGEISYEDWYEDFQINFQSPAPLYKYDGNIYFAAPFTTDVYEVGDSSLQLKYTWKLSPDGMIKEYLEDIRNMESRQEKNERFNYDRVNGIIKDAPVFNAETKKYYYLVLETGYGEGSTRKSIFYNKDNDDYVVFTKFKEGISFRPIFMNDEYALCQVPYCEVETYNKLFGLNIECTGDENPLLAKFYFKE